MDRSWVGLGMKTSCALEDHHVNRPMTTALPLFRRVRATHSAPFG